MTVLAGWLKEYLNFIQVYQNIYSNLDPDIILQYMDSLSANNLLSKDLLTKNYVLCFVYGVDNIVKPSEPSQKYQWGFTVN